MNISQVIAVFLIVFFGSFLQVGMGMGVGMMCMMFFPFLFPLNTAVGLCVAISSFSVCYLAFKYRKYTRWKILIPCALVSVVVSTEATRVSISWNQNAVKIVLGVVLIALSLYFLHYSKYIHVKPTILSGIGMGTLAGIGNGMFGIGGPPIALYLSAAIADNLAYLATIQTYFVISNAVAIVVRGYYGSFRPEHVFVILSGALASFLGTAAGTRFFSTFSAESIRKLIYAAVGISGLTTILQVIFFR